MGNFPENINFFSTFQYTRRANERYVRYMCQTDRHRQTNITKTKPFRWWNVFEVIM